LKLPDNKYGKGASFGKNEVAVIRMCEIGFNGEINRRRWGDSFVEGVTHGGVH